MKEYETNMERLLKEMRPLLHNEPVVFCEITPGGVSALPFEPLGVFREEEGVTIIASAEDAGRAGLASSGWWAHITLMVHSSLSAVGFIAAVATELARAGISVNPVSAFHHDHLFVPWKKREEAISVLEDLESTG